jgi:hypothetical protein
VVCRSSEAGWLGSGRRVSLLLFVFMLVLVFELVGRVSGGEVVDGKSVDDGGVEEGRVEGVKEDMERIDAVADGVAVGIKEPGCNLTEAGSFPVFPNRSGTA